MRTIDRSTAFKRDYKREAKGQHRATLDANLIPVLMALADDQPLEPRHRDHDLSGEWADYRDCHVKPDLVNKGLGAVVEEGKCVTAVFQDKQNAPEAIWALDFRIATQTARTK